jgi:hypothetical protein
MARHFRAGDYLEYKKINHPVFLPPSIDAISQKIDVIYSQIKDRDPVIYLASDDLTYASAMLSKKGIAHITARDLALGENEYDLLALDFSVLTLADILLISNSSFSFTAAMLNKKGKYFFRPKLVDNNHVAFEPWNDLVLRTKFTGLCT